MGDSSTWHEWKTQRPHTYAPVPPRQTGPAHSFHCTPKHAGKHAKHARTPSLTHKHPSCLLWMTWQNCLQANSSYFVIIIQMKDWQQIADLSAEEFDYPLVPERPLMQAVLSWKGSFFLSNRASSATNRRPPLTKWEPARQMSRVSLLLSPTPRLHPHLRWHFLT